MKTFNKIVCLLAMGSLTLALGACSSNHKRVSSKVSPPAQTNINSGSDYVDHVRVGNGFDDAPQSSASGLARSVFYFDFNEDVLTPAAKTDLKYQAEQLRGRDTKIRLEGHADELGSREYNMALSERRANAVARYLRALGVSTSKMQIVAFGEEKLAADGHSSRDHSLNRRVELK